LTEKSRKDSPSHREPPAAEKADEATSRKTLPSAGINGEPGMAAQ
jgi:hypothetical protein